MHHDSQLADNEKLIDEEMMKSDSQPYMQSETGKEEATAGEATINY